MKIKVNWINENNYNGELSVGNTKITSNMNDNEGMKPPEMILSALATCGGLFLRPQFMQKQIEIKSMVIEAEAQKAKPPFMFSKINLHYTINAEVEEQLLIEMIEIAHQKCIVKNTLNPNIEITYTYNIKKDY
jgi:uncharacterized OsmC-like protein